MRNRRAALALCSLALAAQAAELPRKSPEFAISLTDGKQVQVSQYKGKVVALAFILTYCPHCQKALGFLSKDQNEYGARGLQVLASAIETGAAAAVPKFIQQFNPPFPVGFNSQQGEVLEYVQHPPMLIPHMPILVFLDRQGRIRAQYEGDDKFLVEDQMEKNLRDKIEELLKEGAPAAKKSVTRKGAAAPRKQG